MPVQPTLIRDDGAGEEREANGRHDGLDNQARDDASGSTGVRSW
jgi:hypothetical protein